MQTAPVGDEHMQHLAPSPNPLLVRLIWIGDRPKAMRAEFVGFVVSGPQDMERIGERSFGGQP